MQASLSLRRNPVNAALFVVVVLAALAAGAIAGYAIKPAYVVGASMPALTTSIDQPNPSSQPCVFRSGTKGC